MKKLIYGAMALVAFGAFQSCIDDKESVSVTNVRDAKANELNSIADYYEAQAKAQAILAQAEQDRATADAALNAAQEAYYAAQAEYMTAQAAYWNAQAAYQDALTEQQKAETAALLIQNDAALAEAEAKLQAALAQYDAQIALQKYNQAAYQNSLVEQQIAAVELQQKLAEAEIAAQNSKIAYWLNKYTYAADQLNQARGYVSTSMQAVETAQSDVLDNRTNMSAQQELLKNQQAQLSQLQARLETLKEYADSTPEEIDDAVNEAYVDYKDAAAAYQTAFEAYEGYYNQLYVAQVDDTTPGMPDDDNTGDNGDSGDNGDDGIMLTDFDSENGTVGDGTGMDNNTVGDGTGSDNNTVPSTTYVENAKSPYWLIGNNTCTYYQAIEDFYSAVNSLYFTAADNGDEGIFILMAAADYASSTTNQGLTYTTTGTYSFTADIPALPDATSQDPTTVTLFNCKSSQVVNYAEVVSGIPLDANTVNYQYEQWQTYYAANAAGLQAIVTYYTNLNKAAQTAAEEEAEDGKLPEDWTAPYDLSEVNAAISAINSTATTVSGLVSQYNSLSMNYAISEYNKDQAENAMEDALAIYNELLTIQNNINNGTYGDSDAEQIAALEAQIQNVENSILDIQDTIQKLANNEITDQELLQKAQYQLNLAQENLAYWEAIYANAKANLDDAIAAAKDEANAAN